MGINLVVLNGNLTRDPEVKEIQAKGKATHVANFTVAVNRPYKKQDGTKESETTYVDCEAWDSSAKFLGDYMKMGDPIALQGQLKLDKWVDKKDGGNRSKLKVRVTTFDQLYRNPNPKGGKPADEAAPANASADGGGSAGPEDDIPF